MVYCAEWVRKSSRVIVSSQRVIRVQPYECLYQCVEQAFGIRVDDDDMSGVGPQRLVCRATSLMDDAQTRTQVEGSFRVLPREGLIGEEQEAGYQHHEVVVIRGVSSQLADVVTQQSQRLIVLL